AFQTPRAADAEDPDPISSNPDDAAPSFADGASSRWSFGFRLQTPSTITGGLATFPVPMPWPEQSLTIDEQVVNTDLTRATTRVLNQSAKQVVAVMPRVLAGSELEVRVDMTIIKRKIVAPTEPQSWTIPERTPKDLRAFMGVSPHIDTNHPMVRRLSRELAADSFETGWGKVRQIYDAVRQRVRYLEGPIRNASDALRTGQGDCEDMTSLFVALCRNARIPSRMVWVHGHCYPEFYLERIVNRDATTPGTRASEGAWFPCQVAGSEQFGAMEEDRPILQKGDRFKVPETRKTDRYLAEFFQCDPQGNQPPRIEFFRRLIRST
ncbi:MAG: transglutaminase domain-containing protein, partial [Planctomycetota bacterium]